MINVFIFSFSVVTAMSALRFVDNQNGTVTDRGTDLVWQKCERGQDPIYCTGIPSTITWKSALMYCRAMTLNGKTWRLPNINELRSIVDYSKASPVINTVFFPVVVNANYWTSSSVFGDPTKAWYVDMNLGVVDSALKSSGYYVRCVADGP